MFGKKKGSSLLKNLLQLVLVHNLSIRNGRLLFNGSLLLPE